MPKAVKVLLWISAFLACAGVGAYVAAHTDPFPPGVDDPGANSVGPVSTEVPSGGVLVQIDVRTFHDLYVGGRCAISWRIDLGLGATDGEIDGSGVATAKGELRCDEPTAQVQADALNLAATGTIEDGELHFRLDETGRSPVGAQELTGFAKTIPTLRFELPAHEGATAPIDVEVPDRDRGTYGAVGTVTVSTVPA
jgi:hypothetical protein